MQRLPCSCIQGFHFSTGSDSPHIYLAWLAEHLGVQEARDYVRGQQLPHLTRNAYQRKKNAHTIRVYRRFVGGNER